MTNSAPSSIRIAEPPPRILVADRERSISRLIARYLSRHGYMVETAESVAAARSLVRPGRFDVVLTDLWLEDGSGLQLLDHVREHGGGARAILMAPGRDASAAAIAVRRGIDRLAMKPVELAELRDCIEDSLRRLRREQGVVAERENLEVRLRQRDSESRTWVLRSAHALATAVEAKDEYTAGHATRVTEYALTLAEVTGGIDPARLRLAGDLHDVGKIGVPDHVLNKPEHLNEEEYDLIKKHPVTGARILEPLVDDPLVLGVVRSHHERWDGHGYPDGLKGEEIPFAARVLAVADTLDAMTSHRAYRAALPWDTAVGEIRRYSGRQFDPRVVSAFEAAMPRLAEKHSGFGRHPAKSQEPDSACAAGLL